LPLLTVPLAWPLLRKVQTFGEPRELNLVLKGTARLSLWHGLLFALGFVAAGWPLVWR
jgi:1,4-dihydroxy-2-naphthoate octaprenyltransferase